jgi:hypothetical protein
MEGNPAGRDCRLLFGGVAVTVDAKPGAGGNTASGNRRPIASQFRSR